MKDTDDLPGSVQSLVTLSRWSHAHIESSGSLDGLAGFHTPFWLSWHHAGLKEYPNTTRGLGVSEIRAYEEVWRLWHGDALGCCQG